MKRAGLLALALALPVRAYAQPRVSDTSDLGPFTQYTVRAGDSCASIAQRLYHDARRTDLIHASNDLGRAPHRLVPGTVLRLPARAMPLRGPSPDAFLSALGGSVEVLAPTARPGRPNEALFRGSQVSTLDRASAEITFVDESQIRLQERTLVVILGDTSGRVRRATTARDTTLVTGGLRAFLGESSGPRPVTVPIQTPAGRVTLTSGEASVQVSGDRTTLAVYRGRARIRTRRQMVTVPQGYSVSTSAQGAPAQVRALPQAPEWEATPPGILFADASVDLALRWRARAEAPSGWRVQVARDPSFLDRITDARVEAAVTELTARAVAPGRWHLRVSATDADGVESPYSDEAEVMVVRPTVVPTSRPRRSVIELPQGIFCAIDDEGFAPVTAALPIERTASHRLRCSRVQSGAQAAEMTVAPERLGPLTATATLRTADAVEGVGEVRVRVLDGVGAPLVTQALRAEASDGARAGAVASTPEPGVYTVALRWRPGARAATLQLQAGEERVQTEALPLPLPRPTPRARFRDRLSLAVEAGGGTVLSDYQQNRDPQAYGGNVRGFGAAMTGGLSVGVDLASALTVVGSARSWVFPSDLVPMGLSNTYTLGARLSPQLSDRLALVIEASAGAAWTGSLVRPAFDLALGFDLALSRTLSLGPVARYGQVIEPDSAEASNTHIDDDARFWSIGLRAMFRLPR